MFGGDVVGVSLGCSVQTGNGNGHIKMTHSNNKGSGGGKKKIVKKIFTHKDGDGMHVVSHASNALIAFDSKTIKHFD